MATHLRKSALDKLERQPYRFEFFQAVRLLRWLGSRGKKNKSNKSTKPIGRDFSPQEEIVRFKTLPSHRFPQGEISDFKFVGNDATGVAGPPKMTVPFMGMTGPSGALPRHYTQLVIDRTRKKDHALRNFLDLFNHRILSLFHRAWAKYNLPVSYEEHVLDSKQGEDLLTRCLYCLVGLGTKGMKGRLEFDDAAFLYYGGHFAHYPRNAISLQALTSDFFDMPVSVHQFRGQWLYLDIPDQSRMGPRGSCFAQNCRLGIDLVVGQRVWSIESKFRLCVGPVDYKRFIEFSPSGLQLTKLGQLVRSYVGPDLDFDVQIVLQRQEVPPCEVLNKPRPKSRLGWNTWLSSRPMNRDPDDAVFQVKGTPTH